MYESIRRASAAPAAAQPVARSTAEPPHAPATARHDIRRLVDGDSPVMQRQITNAAGVANVYHLAQKQAAYDGQNGFTPPSINGTVYAPSAADNWAHAALHEPTIAVRNDPDAQEFKAKVTAVPANAVGYHMSLPTLPPWRTGPVALTAMRMSYFNIERAVAAHEAQEERDNTPPPMPQGSIPLTTFKKSPASVMLAVTGPVNDATLLAEVTRHETKHAVDIAARRDSVLVPWDQKLTQAQAAVTEYGGASDPLAQAALWTAMGGTPAQIAKQVDDHWTADSELYHASGAGKTHTDTRFDPEQITALVWLTA